MWWIDLSIIDFWVILTFTLLIHYCTWICILFVGLLRCSTSICMSLEVVFRLHTGCFDTLAPLPCVIQTIQIHCSKLESFSAIDFKRFCFFLSIGPLLDDGLKWGTPKAPKGLPLSLLFSVSVCYQATRHSFRPSNLIFENMFFRTMEKKIPVFRNFDFSPFKGPLSAIFEYFLLYPS